MSPSAVPRSAARILCALVLTIFALCAGTAQAQNLVGPCVDGHRWEALATPGNPVVTYTICRIPSEFVTLTCGNGLPDMTITFAFDGVTPGTRLRQMAEVDGQNLPIIVYTRRAHAPGTLQAVIPLEPELRDAMAAGNRMSVQIGQTRVGMHLAASSAALDVMARLC
jgi:hypothetical protein